MTHLTPAQDVVMTIGSTTIAWLITMAVIYVIFWIGDAFDRRKNKRVKAYLAAEEQVTQLRYENSRQAEQLRAISEKLARL